MIQDIEPKIFNNAFHVKQPRTGDTVFVFNKNTVLCKNDNEEICYPTIEKLCVSPDECTYLFSIDDKDFFLLRIEKYKQPKDFTFENITVFRTVMPRDLAFVGFVAYQLFGWYNDTKYCGRCGNELTPSTKERMMHCERCNNMIYPKISPGIIVAITDGDKLLMTKYAGRELSNYALVAGFTEIGESVEKTVEREVMEEVGLKVKNITFYKSQPWAYSSSLLCGFFAEVDGGTAITLETNELASAAWFTRDEIEVQPDQMSLTREMMILFKNGER